MYESRPAQFLS